MTSSTHLYDADFFADVDRGSAQSAAHTVPLLISLIQSLCPSQHIVDVGCGTGAWCSAWQRNGWNVTGIDGGYAATHLRNKTNPEASSDLEAGKQATIVVHLHLPGVWIEDDIVIPPRHHVKRDDSRPLLSVKKIYDENTT